MRARLAISTDVADVLRLLAGVHEAFGEDPPPSGPARAQVVDALAGHSPLRLVIADDGGAAVGLLSLALCPTTRSAGTFALVDDLYVEPGERGRGIARGLLDEASRLAGTWGACEVRLAADKSHRGLLALYRDAGFVEQGMTWLVKELPDPGSTP